MIEVNKRVLISKQVGCFNCLNVFLKYVMYNFCFYLIFSIEQLMPQTPVIIHLTLVPVIRGIIYINLQKNVLITLPYLRQTNYALLYTTCSFIL